MRCRCRSHSHLIHWHKQLCVEQKASSTESAACSDKQLMMLSHRGGEADCRAERQIHLKIKQAVQMRRIIYDWKCSLQRWPTVWFSLKVRLVKSVVPDLLTILWTEGMEGVCQCSSVCQCGSSWMTNLPESLFTIKNSWRRTSCPFLTSNSVSLGLSSRTMIWIAPEFSKINKMKAF